MKSFLQIAAGIDAWLLASIKFTYAAGLCCGLIYRRWLHPLVLAMVALPWAAHQLLVLGSQALGRWYGALLVGKAKPKVPAAPVAVLASKARSGEAGYGRAGGLVLA